MLVSNILRSLPANLEWMVLFNLDAVRPIAGDDTVKAMYFLPDTAELDPYSHVVLSSQGRYLASKQSDRLTEGVTGSNLALPTEDLATRFASKLDLFDVDTADCLGLGELKPYAPVLLHLKLTDGTGKAQAVFDRQPDLAHYELLRAVGVTFEGGEAQDDYYLARFSNRLPTHIHAGILSHFSRTANCNLFFLQQGNIDNNLESGLTDAGKRRIAWGQKRSYQALETTVTAACQQPLSMTCFPPTPESPFSYGDLVPLGFALQALTQNNPEGTTTTQLRQYLLNKRQNNLWAFESDRLITATDSALVLQGLQRSESVTALEEFNNGAGAYYPQLWSDRPTTNKMTVDDSCRHWCQTDYATTCMVKALRKQAGLSTVTPLFYLQANFATRSGLYFANPYLVDYYLAQAIADDQTGEDLRQQLIAEVLASRNPDFSFGTYDRAFSTALAILILDRLNYRGRTLFAAQLKLLEFLDPQGNIPICVPFYSSLRLDGQTSPLLLGLLEIGVMNSPSSSQKQVRAIDEQYHGISLYADTHKIIGTAICAMALGIIANPQQQDLLPTVKPHPRYRCRSHTEYIARFALPPYLLKSDRLEEVKSKK